MVVLNWPDPNVARPLVPAEGNPGASVPPQPDTYTFSQRSTKKAVGEMFGKLPVDVPKFAEYKNCVRSGCNFEINCFPEA